MRLVVDTNRIIAALVKDSSSRRILLSAKCEFLTLGFAKSEIEGHRKELLEKAGITEEQFNAILSVLFSRIFVVDDIAVKGRMREAGGIMDRIDPADTPFIALALAVENDGIWSDDRHFAKQNAIRVWKTSDLLAFT